MDKVLLVLGTAIIVLLAMAVYIHSCKSLLGVSVCVFG